MNIFGKSPVPLPILLIGKISVACSWIFILVKIYYPGMTWYDNPVANIFGLSLFVFGFIVLVLSLINLGNSARVGIPQEETELKTHGLYKFSRNPIYLGVFIMGVGSCLYAVHVLNLILLVITIVVHSIIVKREEEFLEKRFGNKWLEYKQKVPRYIGRIL
jgi:protein-S-isoprenylcysteine O-methyltransferase Ste14